MTVQEKDPGPLRHRHKVAHLESPFGNDAFGRGAEKFARFFGTPKFLVGQTVIVAAWIVLNAFVFIHHWDPYPFILLNLLFSTQAAYAAPMILLASTRQADRDKASAEADALHREEVATRQAALISDNTTLTQQVHELLNQNTELTETIADQTCMLAEIHAHVQALSPQAGSFTPGETAT